MSKRPEEQTEHNLELERAVGTSARQKAVARIREPDRAGKAEARLQRDIGKVRTAKSLGWSREQALEELGWSRSRFLKAEQEMVRQEVRYWQSTRPELRFAEYKAQIEMLCAELGDIMGRYAVKANNPQVLVSAVKVRAELLNKLIETGQSMGLIKQAPRKVEFDARIDVNKSTREIQLQVQAELRKINQLIEDPLDRPLTGVSRVLMEKLNPERRVIDVEAEPEAPPRGTTERVLTSPRRGRGGSSQDGPGPTPPDPRT